VNHEQDQKIKELEQLLLPYKKDLVRYDDQKAIEADLTWNASHFFSKVVYQSESRNDYWNIERVKKLKSEFDKKHPLLSSIDEFIKKQWLRKIAGQIKISSAVRSACYDYERVSDCRNELVFIQHLVNVYNEKVSIQDAPKKQKLAEIDYHSFLTNYEKENKLKLDQNHITKNKWIDFKDNYVKPLNVDSYLTIIENWEDFVFLNHLKDKMNESRKDHLLIKKVILENIHEIHKSCFPETPSLEEFKSKDTLRIYGKCYQLKTYDEDQFLSNYDGKIAAFIWSELANDAVYKDDLERLNKFIELSQFREHLPSLHKYLSKDLGSRFLEAGMKLVLSENDIKGVEQEVYKAFLDLGNGSNFRFASSSYLDEEPLTKSDDYYEFYKELKKRESRYQNNLFYIQESRAVLGFLIWEIMNLDTVYSKYEEKEETKYTQYGNIKKLLSEGLTKPYLLWEVSHLLIQNRPDVIPYLLKESKFAALGVCLLRKIQIDYEIEDLKYLIKKELLKHGHGLALNSLLPFSIENKVSIAQMVCHLFDEINKYKRKTVSNSLPKSIGKWETFNKELEAELLHNLEILPYEGTDSQFKSGKLLLPVIIDDLVEITRSNEREANHRSWLLSLPILKLDLISWLCKCLLNPIYGKQFSAIDQTSKNTIGLFIKSYIDTIELSKVSKKDPFTDEIREVAPSWNERNERLRKIDWVYPMIVMERQRLLDNFLYPKFKFDSSESIVSAINHSGIYKVRSHLYILLNSLNRITSDINSYFIFKKEVVRAKRSIEAAIIHHLNKYSKRENGLKFNIFEANYDRPSFRGEDEQLLPLVAQAIIWFDNKEEIVETLIESTDLTNLLVILDSINSEGIKEDIISKIQIQEIKNYLKNLYGDELELTVYMFSNHPKLLSQAKEALAFWKNRLSENDSSKYKMATFLIELTLAYRENDEKKLLSIEQPKRSLFDQSQLKIYDYKNFFLGLIKYEKYPESAYQIFDQLYKDYPSHDTICLNRFASKIQWAESKLDIELFREAIAEWEFMEKGLKEVKIKTIEDAIWINQLTAYLNLKEFNKFDQLYTKLPLQNRMREKCLSLKIDRDLAKGSQQTATLLLVEAENYHRNSKGLTADFIGELKDKVDSKSNINLLKQNYLDIYSRKPDTLVKVFPENLNEEEEIPRFLVRELVLALSTLLDKIESISDIKKEDKYNDLLQVYLEARMSQWNWVIKAQARGAFSASEKPTYEPGERDLEICNGNHQSFICVEAFILRSKKEASNHLKKLFNYYHNRSNFITLIYYKGNQRNFNTKWNYYTKKIVATSEYPESFSIDVTKTEELVDLNTTSIKIASTKHGENTTIYHIMVNLNYKV